MPEPPPNPMDSLERSSNRAFTPFNAEAGRLGGTSPDDTALVNGVLAGDQNAMAKMFDKYSPVVYSVAIRVLRDSGHAEDVTQEVFLQIWRNPASFVQGRGSLAAWLVVVARNRSIDLLRRRKPSDPVEDVVLVSSVDVASEAERNIATEKIRNVLKKLPQEQQTSVELAFFEGLSHSEIAQRTGDPLGTVKTRIRSALASIRKALAA